MIDELIVEKIKNTEYRDIKEVYADFPNIEQDKILFHVKKNMPGLLNNDEQSSDIPLDETKKKIKKSELIKWCKMNPLITLDALYAEFQSSKPATLRSYRNEALNELIPLFTDFFMSSIVIDNFKIKKESMEELIQYVIVRPRVKDHYLKKNFPNIDIVELKTLREIILNELKKYIGDNDSIDNANASNHDNTNVLDHSSSLDLNQLKDKVAKYKIAQNNHLNEQDMIAELTPGMNQLNQQMQAMQSSFEELISISGDILEKIKKLGNIIELKLKDGDVAKNVDASTHLMHQVLSGIDGNNAGVIGSLIGGILRGTGSVNIDFGKK